MNIELITKALLVAALTVGCSGAEFSSYEEGREEDAPAAKDAAEPADESTPEQDAAEPVDESTPEQDAAEPVDEPPPEQDAAEPVDEPPPEPDAATCVVTECPACPGTGPLQCCKSDATCGCTWAFTAGCF